MFFSGVGKSPTGIVDFFGSRMDGFAIQKSLMKSAGIKYVKKHFDLIVDGLHQNLFFGVEAFFGKNTSNRNHGTVAAGCNGTVSVYDPAGNDGFVADPLDENGLIFSGFKMLFDRSEIGPANNPDQNPV